MGESRRDFGLEIMRKSELKKKPRKRKLSNMMVPNFLYSNRKHFLNTIIIIIIIIMILLIIIIILIFPLPNYSSLSGKATEQNIFWTLKQNLINVLFYRGDFVKIRK